MTSFYIQDPSEAGRTLLDLLAEAACDAERGGGIFAFASERGIKMLLDDSVLRRLTKSATFDLIVGIDAVTNERALRLLAARALSRAGLTVRVMAHDLPSLFHPKLCWFVKGAELTMVLGSGNLTPGGLTDNFEAFTVTTYGPPTAVSVEAQIKAWQARWAASLLAPDAPDAVARAKKNSGSERSLRKPMPPEDEEIGPEPPIDNTADVLVAEITKNAPSRTQVDVGKEHFRDFFGGEPGRQKRIRIRHHGPGALLGEPETRALIETKSDNYRFEARGRGNKEYPAKGRPIGVFIRSLDGVFRYCLVWPGEPGHTELDSLLTKERGADGVRRLRTTVTLLRAEWPDALL